MISLSRKTAFLIVILCLMTCPSFGQLEFDSGRKPFDINRLRIPTYYLEKNSLYHYYENKVDENLLMLHNYITSRLGKIQLEAPLAIYRTPEYDIVAGNQMVGNILPFSDRIPFQGARIARYFPSGAVMAYAGNSDKANNYARPFQRNARDYNLSGLVAKWQVLHNTTVQAGVHQYRVHEVDDSNNTNVLLSIATSPRYGMKGDVTLGWDSKGTGYSLKGPNTALEWNFNYDWNRLNINSSYRRIGAQYGPELDFHFFRGQTNQSHILTYRLSPKLRAYLSYREMKYDPMDRPTSAYKNNYIYNQLTYALDRRTELGAGADQYESNNLSTGTHQTRQGVFGRVRHRMGKADLSYEYRHSKDSGSNNPDSTRFHSHSTGINYNFTPGHILGMSYNNYRNISTDSRSNRNTSNIGLRYRYTLPNEKGNININYNRNQYFDPVLQAPYYGNTQSANMEYWFSQLVGVRGGYYQSENTGRNTSYSGFSTSLIYLYSPNSELRLSYFSNPMETIYYVQDQPVKMKNIVALQLRQSFGGPLQREFLSRWNGAITSRVYYTPKGEMSFSPLTGDMPRVPLVLKSQDLGNYYQTTDEKGEASFRDIIPGTYNLDIDRDKLDPHLNLLGDYSKVVDIAPGTRRTIDFNFEANSSVYAVVWNDFDGSGEIGTPYTGFEGVKVRLNNDKVITTDSNGVARFRDLPPGRAVVEVLPDSFPKGIQSNTPERLEMDLLPGRENLAKFGLQGWGYITGTVRVVPVGRDKSVTEPAVNVPIIVGRETVGQTDEEGRYRVRVPAGSHQLTTGFKRYNFRAYPVTEEIFTAQVEPELDVSRDFTLALSGRIRGQLYEMVDGREVEFRQGGVVIDFTGTPDFLYTDSQGGFLFEDLKVNGYTVSIDPQYVPEGYRLISPDTLKVNILSGQDKDVKFVFQKVP